MKTFFKHHGLSIVLLVLFLGMWIGQVFTGHREHNQDNREHGQPEVRLGQYLGSGHFWEATAENWESEFLQMGAFVILTVFLFQKGSAESKDPDSEDESVDTDPADDRDNPKAPWPVRKGGFALRIYCYSLSLAFLLLFLISFFIHGAAGAREYNQEQMEHGQEAASMLSYMGTSRFWFESLQNWQSEFLSILAMVVLTIFLRQKGSPESKAVAVPHWESEDQWEKEKEKKEEMAAA
jgi:hypothetical protein